MHDPSTSIRKKSKITRTKTGCMPCRQKRKKCDEKKPSCRRCLNGGTKCEYFHAKIKFRDVTQCTADKVEGTRIVAQTPPEAADDILPGVWRCEEQLPEAAIFVHAFSFPHGETVTPRRTMLPPTPSLAADDTVNADGGETSSHSGQSAFENDEVDGRRGNDQDENRDGSSTHYLNTRSSDTCFATFQTGSVMGRPTDFADTQMGSSMWPSTTDFAEVSNEAVHVDCSQMSGDMIDMEHVGDPWIPVLSLVDDDSMGFLCPSTFQPSTLGNHLATNPNLAYRSSPPSEPQYEPSPCTTARRTSAQRSTSGTTPEVRSFTSTPDSTTSSRRPPQDKWPAVGDRLYLAHFKVGVLDNLPVRIPSLWQLVMGFAPVRYAACAVAAASLANQQGGQAPGDEAVWIPKPAHSKMANRFASLGTTTLRSGESLPLGVRLAILLLNVCYELEAGSMDNVWQALLAFDSAVFRFTDEIVLLAGGYDILRSWIHFHSMCEMYRRPQSPFSIESSVNSLFGELELTVATEPHIISSIGTKATRIWQRIIMMRYSSYYDGVPPSDALQKIENWWFILMGDELDVDTSTKFSTILSEKELFDELRSLKTMLDNCEPPTRLTHDTPHSSHHAAAVPSRLNEVQCFRFPSHREAMDAADYAFAHIVCDESLLRSLVEQKDALSSRPARGQPFSSWSNDNMAHTTPWVDTLLRIVSGLDVRHCGRYNMYRKGITTYLHLTSLFCPSLDLFNFIDIFLQRAIDAGVFYEGSFSPIHACQTLNRLLRRKASSGRRAFFACVTYDQKTPRTRLFSKATGEYVMLMGRQANGLPFFDHVPMVEAQG